MNGTDIGSSSQPPQHQHQQQLSVTAALTESLTFEEVSKLFYLPIAEAANILEL
ncbi:hypothetical protein QJS10_CPB12g00630 [Acorus calamus]|uniref:Uncharacterized protein n=1 Tax=Acorus calamus TaxID=4465 RepID=A0AAV9DKK8_ACOCL|nr:hypothetical protein QJS10_CPB12g00630 [Acorus calamus]